VDVGHKVEVRSQFDQSWSNGFEIEECVRDDDGVVRFRVRRLSDGMVLPRLFSDEDVRRPRKRDMWWYG
jgi:hypothetical protein